MTRQLTQSPLNFRSLSEIPGSRDIAVIGTQQRGELLRFDLLTQRFVPFLNGISAEMIDFSRDGKWAVYVTYPERDLWRSRPDGTEAVRLTHKPLLAAMPRISPHGTRVAFSGDYSGVEMRTWLVPLAGGDPTPADSLPEGAAEVSPTWSPDGTKLLYRFDHAAMKNVLRILDLASGVSETIPGSQQKFNQRWFPDGKWIAATPNDGNGLELFSVASRQWKTLSGMHADYPSWSHDSRYVYFCGRREDGEEAIYRAPVSPGATERIARLAGIPRALDQMYNQWTGLAPDDSPLIVKSADLRQIYVLSMK